MVSSPEKISDFPRQVRSHWKIWVAMFVLALLSRGIFLTAAQQLPVFWDARIYASAAIGLLGYADRGDAFGKGSGTGDDFQICYRKYLAGEDINWLYYRPPTLIEAQKYLFYSGPVYPALMAAVFALPWSNDFQAVRWCNALLDSLSIVFVAMAAFLLWRNRRAAILAAVVQLLYIPLVITCGVLALETITSFLVSLMLFLLLWHLRTDSIRLAAAAGAVAGILFLTKPTAALLTVPVFLFWLIIYLQRKRHLLKIVLWYLIPFGLLVIPWTAFTSQFYGTLAIRDPEYATANFRSSSSIPYEGYDLDFSDPDFWTYSVPQHILGDLPGYGNLLLKKLVRLWWTPHDEFWQGPRWFETTYHRLIVLAALFGLAAIPLADRRFLFLPALLILYYTGLHCIFHAVPRYNFNALPAMFLLIVAVIQTASGLAVAIKPARRNLVIAGGVALILILLNFSALDRIVLRLVPVAVPLAITLILLILMGYFVISKILSRAISVNQRRLLWLPFIVLSLTAVTGWTRPQMKEWSIPLRDNTTRLVAEISLPPGIAVFPDDEIMLALDIATSPERSVPVQIDIEGQKFRFDDGCPPIDKAYYIKGSYGPFDKVMGLKIQQLRWYRTVKIPPELFQAAAADGRITISVGSADTGTSNPDITIYGDPSVGGTTARIPSFSHTSIERFKEWGDRRLYESYRLESTGVSWHLENGNARVESDYARDGDSGRPRIYFALRHSNFTRLYF